MARSQTRRSNRAAGSRSTPAGAVGAAFEAARERLGGQATELVQQVKENGQEFLTERKGVIASEMVSVSSAIRRAADKLQDAESELLAGYVDSAADRVEEIGRYIEQHDLGDVVDDVGEFARRQPLLFMGGMFVAGLAAARFVKSGSAARTGRGRRG